KRDKNNKKKSTKIPVTAHGDDATKAFQLVTATSLFRGLSNPSTMCYGNSVIQMLSKTSLFRSSFDTYCQNEESLGDLHIALKKVFDSLADSLNANAVDASEFIRKSRPFYFEESAHEDAEEYLRHLLNQLQAESTSEISPSYISETFEGCQSRASYCATCCEKIDRQEETFTSLILSLKQTEEGTLSIQDMVDSLYTESIENTSKCEKCEGDDDGAYSRNRHHSDPPQLKNIISKCISFILMQLHSESDFVLIFQFFLKCTSMIPGFRGDLWINGILFEAVCSNTFVKSLIGQLIDETISYIRTQNDFVFELHVILAVLFILLLRLNLFSRISADTLNSILAYLEDVSKQRNQTGKFLQHFYAHHLSVLKNYVWNFTLLDEERRLVLQYLRNMLDLFPIRLDMFILASLTEITTISSGPLNFTAGFEISSLWRGILELINNALQKNPNASKVCEIVPATPPYRGLKNSSAICYGNSVIQMLSKTSLFRSSFDTYCQNEESLGDLHIALKKVFDSLADSLNANAVDASEFIRKSRPFYFEESAHEDAEEYLRHLLNQLQAESTSEISPSYISETFEGCQSRASYCATCCEKIDRQEETFTSLILSLKQTEEGTLSIQDMVDSLYTESIENTSKCEKCEGDDDGAYSRNVTITFQKTPPCLLLNVKIFYYD
ncbi:unnamed protein product, partial [Hymenolepis diminuta]